MQRNFLRGLLICLIPCLLAAVFAVRPEKYRLGIDLAGGTILVYEINLERSYQR
jgi:SecD/SecF fusion protein